MKRLILLLILSYPWITYSMEPKELSKALPNVNVLPEGTAQSQITDYLLHEPMQYIKKYIQKNFRPFQVIKPIVGGEFLEFSPGQNMILNGRKGLRLYNLETSTRLCSFDSWKGTAHPQKGIFDATGTKVAIWSKDLCDRHEVEIWDLNLPHSPGAWNNACHYTINHCPNKWCSVIDVKFDSTGKKIVLATTSNKVGDDQKTVVEFQHKVKMFEIETGECLFEFTEDSLIRSISFSPDEKTLLVASITGVTLLNPLTGEAICKLPVPIRSAHYTATGDKIVTISRENVAALWNAVTGECLHSPAPKEPYQQITSITVNSEGTLIATGLADGSVVVKELMTGTPRYTLSAGFSQEELISYRNGYKLENEVSATFSPNGRYVLTQAGNSSLSRTKLWDAETGELLSRGFCFDLTRGAISFHGDMLALYATYNGIQIFDLSVFKLLKDVKRINQAIVLRAIINAFENRRHFDFNESPDFWEIYREFPTGLRRFFDKYIGQPARQT